MENEAKTKLTVLTPSCQVYGKDFHRSGPLTCQGTLLNQSETTGVSKQLSGTSNTAKAPKNGQKEDDSLEEFLSRLYE